MNKIYLIIISIATLLNSILVILSFISKVKKSVDITII